MCNMQYKCVIYLAFYPLINNETSAVIYLVLETFDQKKQARQMVIGILGYR